MAYCWFITSAYSFHITVRFAVLPYTVCAEIVRSLRELYAVYCECGHLLYAYLLTFIKKHCSCVQQFWMLLDTSSLRKFRVFYYSQNNCKPFNDVLVKKSARFLKKIAAWLFSDLHHFFCSDPAAQPLHQFLLHLLCKHFVMTICIPQLSSWLCFYLHLFLHKVSFSTINLE